MSEFVIDENNFDQLFFDARKNGPKKDQVMACYEAVAEFVEGDLKVDIVNLLLSNDNAAESAPRVFQKLGCSSYQDSINVVKEMTEDLLSLSVNEVLEKPYQYHLQMFYYTKDEHIPRNDPHWSKIKLLNVLDTTYTENLEEDEFDPNDEGFVRLNFEEDNNDG